MAGKKRTTLADSAFEPDTSDDAGIDQQSPNVPIDAEPLPGTEARQEGAGVSSAHWPWRC